MTLGECVDTSCMTQIQLGYSVTTDRAHPLGDFRGRVLMHRMVMFDEFGWGPHPCFFCGLELPFRTGRKQAWPNWGIEVDHIDADRANNDITNLAFVCPSHQTRSGMQGDHTSVYLTWNSDSGKEPSLSQSERAVRSRNRRMKKKAISC